MSDAARTELLDLRGVRCPLNWARARVRLEQLAQDGALELWLDDPRAIRDIPRAAEAAGYLITDVAEAGPGLWKMRIVR